MNINFSLVISLSLQGRLKLYLNVYLCTVLKKNKSFLFARHCTTASTTLFPAHFLSTVCFIVFLLYLHGSLQLSVLPYLP